MNIYDWGNLGEDISPDFIVNDIPSGTKSLAIILDDLDVPFRKEFCHWLIWNIEPVEYIPEGIEQGAKIDSQIRAIQGMAWGEHGYRGPKQPPFIKKAHTYRFTIYALDIMLEISCDANKKELQKAMEHHIIDSAELYGEFDPMLKI